MQELLDAGTTYYTAVQAIIPLAASSEAVFTRYYDAFVRGRASRPRRRSWWASTARRSAPRSRSGTSPTWTRGHAELAAAVRADPAAVWAGGGPEPADEWRARFRAHLDRYGHATYNLDFVHPTPVDDPAPLFEALRFALDGGGAEPYARQPASAARREELSEAAARASTRRGG